MISNLPQVRNLREVLGKGVKVKTSEVSETSEVFRSPRSDKMRTILQFLKPDWRRALLFAVFAFITIGGHIQSWAFSDVPPKPPLYDLLRPFPIWPIWVILLLPLGLLSLPLRAVGLDLMASSFWLFAAAKGLYFYLLSSILVAGFDRYGARLPRWLWAAILIVPPAFQLLPGLAAAVLFGQPLMPDVAHGLAWTVLSLLSSSLVGSLYLYLLACLGFFVYDIWKRRRLPKP